MNEYRTELWLRQTEHVSFFKVTVRSFNWWWIQLSFLEMIDFDCIGRSNYIVMQSRPHGAPLLMYCSSILSLHKVLSLWMGLMWHSAITIITWAYLWEFDTTIYRYIYIRLILGSVELLLWVMSKFSKCSQICIHQFKRAMKHFINKYQYKSHNNNVWMGILNRNY
jgi:hypothetical protein